MAATYRRYFASRVNAIVTAERWRRSGNPEARVRKVKDGWAIVLDVPAQELEA